MHVARSTAALATIATIGLLTPALVVAQERAVVAHSVSVSRDGSSLALELADGKSVTIELSDGNIRINGASLGSYAAGGELDASWRALLSHGGSLSSSELLDAFSEWEVEGLEAAEFEIQAAIEASLGNLDAIIASAVSEAQAGVLAEDVARETVQELERALELDLSQGLVIDLDRLTGAESITERIDVLREELQELNEIGFQFENGMVHVGDLTVRRGQVIEGNVAVLSGDVSVYGTVAGNLVALEGDIVLRRSGRIEGDALAINGTVTRAGGFIAGEARSARGLGTVTRRQRGAVAQFTDRSRAVNQVSGVEAVGQSVATLIGFFIALASIGFGVTFFAPRQLDVVSSTVSNSFGRSFLAGMFAQPLLIPVAIALIAGLAITIVGIPIAVLVALALPFACVGIALFGYLAAARSVGNSYLLRRLAEGHAGDATPYRSVVFGLIGLLAIWAPAVILGWIPLVGQLFLLLAAAVTWVMATAGIGAAILSRAGLRATFARAPHQPALTDEHYWPADSAATPARRSRPRR